MQGNQEEILRRLIELRAELNELEAKEDYWAALIRDQVVALRERLRLRPRLQQVRAQVRQAEEQLLG